MTILDALKAVASHDPDLARDRNFVGFSGLDTRFACKLASRHAWRWESHNDYRDGEYYTCTKCGKVKFP